MGEQKVLILYGSQTGTAQDIAERIWREARNVGVAAAVLCMDDYDIGNLIYEPVVVFVCATTGQGEEPDNMKTFWKFLLRKSLPRHSLQNMKYAGLGDSSYIKYNFVAKRLSKRLDELGGQPLVDIGLADDQHDLGAAAVVDPWLDKLWLSVGQLYNFSPLSTSANKTPVPRWTAETVSLEAKALRQGSSKLQPNNKIRGRYTQRDPALLTVLDNKRTTAEEHFQDVRLVRLKIPADAAYKPGDVLMLVPHNTTCKVEELFQVLNAGRDSDTVLSLRDVVKVGQRDGGMPVPEALHDPIYLEECATKYWDLNSIPRRYVFSVLANLTSSDLEKEKLLELSQVQGQEELYNYCNRPRRNILEVLHDFPNATKNISLEYLFEILQPIRPRAFSIASAATAHEGEVHILLAVVEYKTKLLAPRFGLASRFLSQLTAGTHIHGWIMKGSLEFPPPDKPLIMVGPGTGVAPFRSHIQHLAATGQASKHNLLLFFGCRNEKADFHCREEWEQLQKEGKLTFFCAFSRDQPHKRYVQHVMLEHGQLLWELISKQQACIFVAGSSKNMPKAVRDAVIDICVTHGGMDSETAEHLVATMEKTARYQTETWS